MANNVFTSLFRNSSIFPRNADALFSVLCSEEKIGNINIRYCCFSSFPDATRFDSISYHEVLVRGLQVMDATATALAQDNHMPIIVLNIEGEDTIKRALAGESVGTVVLEEE